MMNNNIQDQQHPGYYNRRSGYNENIFLGNNNYAPWSNASSNNGATFQQETVYDVATNSHGFRSNGFGSLGMVPNTVLSQQYQGSYANIHPTGPWSNDVTGVFAQQQARGNDSYGQVYHQACGHAGPWSNDADAEGREKRSRNAAAQRKHRAKKKQEKEDLIKAALAKDVAIKKLQNEQKEHSEQRQHERYLETLKLEGHRGLLYSISKQNPTLAAALDRYGSQDGKAGDKLVTCDRTKARDELARDMFQNDPFSPGAVVLLGQNRMDKMSEGNAEMYYLCEQQRRSDDRMDRQQNQENHARRLTLEESDGVDIGPDRSSDLSSDGSTVEEIIISTGNNNNQGRGGREKHNSSDLSDLSSDEGSRAPDWNVKVQMKDNRGSQGFSLNDFSEEDDGVAREDDDGVASWNIQEMIDKANKESANKEASYEYDSSGWKNAREQGKRNRERVEQKKVREEKFYDIVVQEEQEEEREQAEAEREQAETERQRDEAKARDLEASILILAALSKQKKKALREIRLKLQLKPLPPPPPKSP